MQTAADARNLSVIGAFDSANLGCAMIRIDLLFRADEMIE